jgi:hypothetical protein
MFLGMVNYLSNYITSWITQPLYTLLKEKVQWDWRDKHQRAFDKCKEAHA